MSLPLHERENFFIHGTEEVARFDVYPQRLPDGYASHMFHNLFYSDAPARVTALVHGKRIIISQEELQAARELSPIGHHEFLQKRIQLMERSEVILFHNMKPVSFYEFKGLDVPEAKGIAQAQVYNNRLITVAPRFFPYVKRTFSLDQLLSDSQDLQGVQQRIEKLVRGRWKKVTIKEPAPYKIIPIPPTPIPQNSPIQ